MLRKLKRIRPEVFILILLVICVTYVLQFDSNNGRKGAALVIDENQQVSIVHVKNELSEHRANGRDVLQYKPDACQLAQIYDEEYNLVFSVSFTNDASIFEYISKNTSDSGSSYLSDSTGSVKVNINGTNHKVDFGWDEVAGTKYLIVYVSSMAEESSLNLFIGACHLTLILALTLFINTLYWNSKDVTRRYDQIRREMNSRML